MKISTNDIEDMIIDLQEKGRALIKNQKENVIVDEEAIAKDYSLIQLLSRALQDDLDWYETEEQVRRVHKDFMADKINLRLKKNYGLKDEIRKAAVTAKSYKEIIDLINPLAL